MARQLPSIDELVAGGRLVAQAPDPVALRAVLAAARRDLEAAEANRSSWCTGSG